MKSACLVALLVLGSIFSGVAQVPEPLSFPRGKLTEQATGTRYSVSSSGQAEQNRQEVQFRIERNPSEKNSTETAAITLRTGKQKTVGQVIELSRKVFQKFLEGQPRETALGKLGSLDKGGEVIFIAESAEVLRFDFKSPDAEAVSIRLSRVDATAFLAILHAQ